MRVVVVARDRCKWLVSSSPTAYCAFALPRKKTLYINTVSAGEVSKNTEKIDERNSKKMKI